jgi:hypothetical protein
MIKHMPPWQLVVLKPEDGEARSVAPIAELYRETQIAIAALMRASKILEEVACTLPPDH